MTLLQSLGNSAIECTTQNYHYRPEGYMRQLIPAPLLGTIAEVASLQETHASLNSLFMYAGAPGDPPEGSKAVKAEEWLRQINKDSTIDPLVVAGRIIEKYMEAVPDYWNREAIEKNLERLQKALSRCELQYIKGGRIIGLLAAPSQTLEKLLTTFDFVAVNEEFNRALANVESEPREAVSAASNILESFCKIYISANQLPATPKQDLKAVWGVVRKHLGFDPSAVQDQDLQTILTGLLATVEGIGSLRTHASSAHGAGTKVYKLEPRHARLAIHAAHTVTLFALETWQKRK
jgi:hypothetical protein